MIVRTFTAPDLDQACWLLNEDLGPAAVILKTHFGSTTDNPAKAIKFVEITAALDSSLYGRDDLGCIQAITFNAPQSLFPPSDSANKAGYNPDLTVQAEIIEVIGW